MQTPALRPMDRLARLARLRAALPDAGVDGLVVTKPQNIRWLTGFTGSSGTVALTADAITLITDDRYRTVAAQQLDEAGVEAAIVIDRDLSGPLTDAVGRLDRVGLEAGHVTWDRATAVERWLDDATVVPTVGLIEGLRRVKDRGEIDRLGRAAAIADAALAHVAPGLVPGRTEKEVARELERAMVDRGADGLSFPTIVAAGPNSAKPHAVPSDRELAPGDLVVIDFGASVDGYGSDMTRSFLIDPVDEADLELYRAVERAQAAGVAAVGDGVEERAVDEACRRALADRGLAEAFVHGTGHGIGLEIHEDPFLSTRSTGILRSGYVVTVEPGVYLPERGGVRVEDSVVVTDRGCEPLTRSPKDPLIPGR
jgi:Xaa-Pro aminopeptidase